MNAANSNSFQLLSMQLQETDCTQIHLMRVQGMEITLIKIVIKYIKITMPNLFVKTTWLNIASEVNTRGESTFPKGNYRRWHGRCHKRGHTKK